jgi:hypothetical protein
MVTYRNCQRYEKGRHDSGNRGHCVMFLSEFMLICARSSWLYFRIMKQSSNRDSWDETCNHDEQYLMKLRQRICARGEVQFNIKQSSSILWLWSLRGFETILYSQTCQRADWCGQKIWRYGFDISFSNRIKTSHYISQ